MSSKYRANIEHYLDALMSHTDLKLRISNDGNNHFIVDDQGHTIGHGQSMSDLYSSVFFAAEFLGLHKVGKLEIRGRFE